LVTARIPHLILREPPAEAPDRVSDESPITR